MNGIKTALLVGLLSSFILLGGELIAGRQPVPPTEKAEVRVGGLMGILSTHPSTEDRISRLQQWHRS